LDILRTLKKETLSLEALRAELKGAAGHNAFYDRYIRDMERAFVSSGPDEFGARRLAQTLGVALQASLLVRNAPKAISDAFCATRLGGGEGHPIYGLLPGGTDAKAILARVLP
jgi:putative acyl-CoA dehydrogenase